MTLMKSLRSEMVKTRKTTSYYGCLVAAALLPLVQLADYCTDDNMISKLQGDPWNLYYLESYQEFSLFLLPMFLILVSTFVPQIEYRNNAWRQVLTAPQQLSGIFLSKFLVIHLLILLCVVGYQLFMAATAIILQWIRPDTGFFDQAFPFKEWLVAASRTYISVLAFSAAQFWLAMRFRNFLVPIGAGFCLWLAAVMLVFELHSPLAIWFPFSYPILNVQPDYAYMAVQLQWFSFGFAILFLIPAFINFRRKKHCFS